MSFVLRTVAAVTALSAFVSAAGVYSNSTTVPTPASVPGWKYDGCVSTYSTASWDLVDTSDSLTIEHCLLDCSAYTFAAINGEDCYCGLSVNGTTVVDASSCHKPCPGDATEACGGIQGAPPIRRRQILPGGPLYSLYEKAVVPEGDIYISVITNVYVSAIVSDFPEIVIV
jgi:hypothetical protein